MILRPVWILLFVIIGAFSANATTIETDFFCELTETFDEWVIHTVEIKDPDNSEIIFKNEFIVKVKVRNESTYITNPVVIRNKARLIRQAVEEKYSLDEVIVDDQGVATIHSYRTKVILDYLPQLEDDDMSIGHLIFIDEKSKHIETTSNTSFLRFGGIKRTTITTTTKYEFLKGWNVGRINFFKIYIVLTVDGELTSDKELKKTAYHEFGHSASLNHPWELDEFEKSLSPELDQSLTTFIANRRTILANIMNSDENPILAFRSEEGEEILQGQLEFMAWKIKQESFYVFDELSSWVSIRHSK